MARFTMEVRDAVSKPYTPRWPKPDGTPPDQRWYLRIQGTDSRGRYAKVLMYTDDANPVAGRLADVLGDSTRRTVIECEGRWETLDRKLPEGNIAKDHCFKASRVDLVTGPAVELMLSKKDATAVLARATEMVGAGNPAEGYAALEDFMARFVGIPAPSLTARVDLDATHEDEAVEIEEQLPPQTPEEKAAEVYGRIDRARGANPVAEARDVEPGTSADDPAPDVEVLPPSRADGSTIHVEVPAPVVNVEVHTHTEVRVIEEARPVVHAAAAEFPRDEDVPVADAPAEQAPTAEVAQEVGSPEAEAVPAVAAVPSAEATEPVSEAATAAAPEDAASASVEALPSKTDEDDFVFGSDAPVPATGEAAPEVAEATEPAAVAAEPAATAPRPASPPPGRRGLGRMAPAATTAAAAAARTPSASSSEPSAPAAGRSPAAAPAPVTRPAGGRPVGRVALGRPQVPKAPVPAPEESEEDAPSHGPSM